MENHDRDILIVGGGPAGMMAGLLFARAGLRVTVLEKHKDFLRDFRGDTIHPSTLQLFHQMGMIDDLLKISHNKLEQAKVRMAGRVITAVDFRKLPVVAPYIAMMPQWDLLNFIAEKASKFPGFELRMGSEAFDVIVDHNDRIDGVRLASGEGLHAKLVIAADGRRSILRGSAKLPLKTIGAPLDVFWFRLDKPSDYGGDLFASIEAGRFMILIDRGEYFQCAFVFNKGQADKLKAAGLDQFRQSLRALVPDAPAMFDQLQDWSQVKTLDVALDRLQRWHRPGLLAIGDAAHAMSPIGGVGINFAVQDAVAAANVLAQPMIRGENPDPFLHQIYDRRIKPVKRMQGLQKFVQDNVLARVLARKKPYEKPALPLRALDRFPFIRRIPGRVIGMGFGREEIRSPEA